MSKSLIKKLLVEHTESPQFMTDVADPSIQGTPQSQDWSDIRAMVGWEISIISRDWGIKSLEPNILHVNLYGEYADGLKDDEISQLNMTIVNGREGWEITFDAGSYQGGSFLPREVKVDLRSKKVEVEF